MKIWLAALGVLLAFDARADVTGSLTCDYAQTIASPFSFRKVEFINHSPKFGLRHTGAVTLNPRVDIGENAWLGLDQEGRLLNVVRVGDRTLAFLLSGTRKIKDFYFRPPMTLVALDADGKLLQFDWREGMMPKLTRRLFVRAQKFAGTFCVAQGFVALYALWLHVAPTDLEFKAGVIMATVAPLAIHAFSELFLYGWKNQNTDGLRELGVGVTDFKRSEFERGPYGHIEDYTLSTREGTHSLNALVADRLKPASRGFEADCAYELIPDGRGGMEED